MPLDTFFKGPYYNRRRSLQAKPHIRKLRGVDTWVCQYRYSGPQIPGFGLTPSEAYRDWKASQQC